MLSDPASLPARPIEEPGEISNRLQKLGLADLREVASYVQTLPYGRIDDRSDLTSVIDEGVGTCSTKHALLAQVSNEQGIDGVQLTLGIYEMDDRNTPGVGAVLQGHELEHIPEAHCYLTYDGDRLDFTRADADGDPITDLLFEEPIRPSQIGEYKRDRHRAFLADWIETTDCDITLEELWQIREACIERLSHSTA